MQIGQSRSPDAIWPPCLGILPPPPPLPPLVGMLTRIGANPIPASSLLVATPSQKNPDFRRSGKRHAPPLRTYTYSIKLLVRES